MKLLRNTAIIIAVVLILGSVGSCDLNRITLAQALWQVAIGFVFAFVAWFCHRVIVLRQMAKRRRARKSNTQPKERYYA